MCIRPPAAVCVIALVLSACAEPDVQQPDEASAALRRAADGWPMAGHDPQASHSNPSERKIGAGNAATLRPRWRFDAFEGEPLDAFSGTPVVTDRAVYVGSSTGRFFALNLEGELLWEYVTLPPNDLLGILATPTPVGGHIPVLHGTPIGGGAVYSEKEDAVVFGDLDGNLYALDAETGAELWVKPQVDAHPLGGVIGNSLLLAGDDVVVGFAAIEGAALLLPSIGIPYTCCSHTGLVAAFDVKHGSERWRYDTIAPADVQPLPSALAPFELGPSGADVWAQPTYDAATQTIYVTTGQNFSPDVSGQSSGTSDAIIALHAKTGRPKWIRQITSGDVWLEGIPNPDANGVWRDQDFGDAAKIYRLPNGRKVVAAAQKSGAYVVLDAATGAVVKTTQIVQQASQLGGLQNGSAYGHGSVFVHGLHGLDPSTSTGPFVGVIKALSPDGARVRWSYELPGAMFAAPLALANGVVYGILPVSEANVGSDPQQFSLLGLDAATGKLVASLPFSGRAVSGPVVANGRVYVVSGNRAIAQLGADDRGAVIALELPPAP